MDSTPIKNNNPTDKETSNTIVKKTKHSSQIFETLKNFIFMLPFACVICYQMKILGNSFGEFFTFPPFSAITYIFIGCILILLLLMQIMMRSIIYTSVSAIVLLYGIFSAWFGDVYNPIIENFSRIIEIIRSAWTRKSIPFELLMTSIMTTLIFLVTFTQFVTSLLVKSFFEMFFGKKWGDGKWMAYLVTIALILGVQLSFNYYVQHSNSEGNKLIWKNYEKYSSLEKYISKTPGSITYNEEYLWLNNGKELKAFQKSDGKEINRIRVSDKVFTKGIEKSAVPIVFLEDRFVGYTTDLKETSWDIYYPNMQSSDTITISPESQVKSNPMLPLTRRFLKSGKYMLVIYDFGRFGLYDISKGLELWSKVIDQPAKTSRTHPDRFLNDISILEKDSKIIISCQNGIIKNIDMLTGNLEWEYRHTVSKLAGKPQRGILSDNDSNLIVSFKTGEIISLSYKDGHVINKTLNEDFVTSSPVFCKNNTACFLTDEGLYYEVKLDDGKIESRLNALPNKSEIYPALQNNQNGVYAHRDKIYVLNSDLGYSKILLTSKNRTFITNPIVDENNLYIGTADGWVYCINLGTERVKWIVHVDGELTDDSLTVIDNTVIVKSKSDSIFTFTK